MSRMKVVVGLAVVGLLASVWIGQALSQEEAPAAERRRRFDPERMRQMILERIKENLGATDEDWKVLKPKVEKVQTLSRQARGGGGMGMFFGRRRRRPAGEGEAAPTRELSAVEKKVQELQTLLENEEAKPEEITKKLTALREAREKAKQKLAKAQKQLRELLSVRQEAQLVLMGLLD